MLNQCVAVSFLPSVQGTCFLTLNCISESVSFAFEADFDLVEKCFVSLDMLYWQSPLQLTPVRVTGILLTNPLDAEHVCGSVMPAQALERTVSSALRAISIELFCRVACFVFPDVRCYKCDSTGVRTALHAVNTAESQIYRSSISNSDASAASIEAMATSAMEMFEQRARRNLTAANPQEEEVYETLRDTSCAKSRSLRAVSKAWDSIKEQYSMSSDFIPAKRVDAKIRYLFELLSIDDEGGFDEDRSLLSSIRASIIARLTELQAKGDYILNSSINALSPLTNLPNQLRECSAQELWNLIVLAEATGARRVFSALAYVMLHNIRSGDISSGEYSSGALPLSTVAQHLETYESELDRSLSVDNVPDRREEESRKSFCSSETQTTDELLETSVLNNTNDTISREKRVVFPPTPEAHPNSSRHGASFLTSTFKSSPVPTFSSPAYGIPTFVTPELDESLLDFEMRLHAEEADAASKDEDELVQRETRLAAIRPPETYSAASIPPRLRDNMFDDDAYRPGRNFVDDTSPSDGLRSSTPRRHDPTASTNIKKSVVSSAVCVNRASASSVKPRGRSPSPSNASKPQSNKYPEFTDPDWGRRRAAERIRVAKAAEEAAKLQEALSRMTIKERVHLLELRTSQTRLRLALNRSRSASPSSKPAESQDSFDDAVVPPPPSTPKAAQVKRIAQQESKSPARTMPSPDSVSQADEVENARLRAIQRVRSKRQELELKRLEDYVEAEMKQNDKWVARDQRISQFLARQQKSPSHGSILTSPLSAGDILGDTKSKMITKPLNKVADNGSQPLKALQPEAPLVKKYRRFSKLNYSSGPPDDTSPASSNTGAEELSAVHPSVALASEVELLIEDALSPRLKQVANGSVRSRSSSPGRSVRLSVKSGAFSPDKTWRENQDEPRVPHPSGNSMPVTVSGDRPETQVKGILKKPSSIKVIKAIGLEETISGCSPYIVIDWGELGSASTPTVHEKTDPVYNHTLHFGRMDTHAEVPSLNVFVYHKNVSVSDEVLGTGHLSSVNVRPGINTINLFGPTGIEAGKVVIDIMF